MISLSPSTYVDVLHTFSLALCVYIKTCIYPYAYMHKCIPTYLPTSMHAYITYIQTYIVTNIKYIYIHTHTHKQEFCRCIRGSLGRFRSVYFGCPQEDVRTYNLWFMLKGFQHMELFNRMCSEHSLLMLSLGVVFNLGVLYPKPSYPEPPRP